MKRALAVLGRPWLVGSALLYAAVQLNKRWLHGPVPTGISSYLADLLCLPLVLGVALAAHQGVYGRAATLPGGWVLAAWAIFSLWFEGLLPHWSAQAVADPWDVAAYAAGALIFYRWLNKPG